MREHRTLVGRAPTRLLEADGDGPPLVLLHGFTDSADSWRPVLRELEAAGRRAVAADLPGFGEAAPSPPGPLLPALDAFVADLVAEAGGGEPVVLVGNSLGGVLALRAAAGGELPLVAAVPVAPAGFGFTARIRRMGRAFGTFGPVLRLYGRLPYPGWLVRDLAARFYAVRFGLGRAEPELARRYAAHLRNGIHDVRRIAALGGALGQELRTDAADLAAIRVPVLLVWGRHDAVCDVAGAQEALAAVPGSRLVVLEDSGHLPQLQQPAELAALLVAAPQPALR